MRPIEILNRKIDILEKEKITFPCQIAREQDIDAQLEVLDELKTELESVPAETLVMPKIAEDKIKTLDDLLFEWKYGKRKPYQPLYIVDILVAIEMLFAEELKKVR